MGYASYKNLEGRDCGYAEMAVCDQPGCGTIIDRGYDYLCGTTERIHSEDQPGCGGYFCEKHRPHVRETLDGTCISLCVDCFDGARTATYLKPED